MEDFSRLPPHSIEGEQCLLASAIIDKEMMGQIVLIITCKEMFFQVDHQIIWEILCKLYEAGQTIDVILLREELVKRNLLEEVGGVGYLATLLNTVPSAANGPHYAGVVREKFLLRSLQDASQKSLTEIHAPHEKADDIVDRAESRILQLSERRVVGGPVAAADIVEGVFDEIVNQSQPKGLMTEFYELDTMLNGLRNGEMIIVAGRPSIGKTAFGLNIIERVSILQHSDVPSLFFSMEMSKEALVARSLASLAMIKGDGVRQHRTSADEQKRLADAMVKIIHSKVHIDDFPAATIMSIRAKARRLKMQKGLRLIMVDYLQLMDAPEIKESRQQQITTISRGLKGIARELNVPVIALSQLNRASENREGHRPRMSDLRESGSIEQDADVVILLHREDYYRQTEPDFIPDNIAEVIVAKQRNGPTGVVKLTFFPDCTRFENLAVASF